MSSFVLPLYIALITLLMISGVAGCASKPAAHTVATDVQTVDKPVTTRCSIEWPKKPTPHVANWQATGNDAVDAVIVGRAAEAELEELRAYRAQLEAAARKCVEPR